MNQADAIFNGQVKLGVLGGGQLGKMMALAAANWQLPFWVMDTDPSLPAAPYATHFMAGDFRNEADVLAFGEQVDVITIEIEDVHTGALHQLKARGKQVHPDPAALDIIKDKGLQKQLYAQHGLPTSPFALFDDKSHIIAAWEAGKLTLPFVQKSRTGGYDGRGVFVVHTTDDMEYLLEGPSLVEQKVNIVHEVAVIVAQNANGEQQCFDAVEMVFDPVANLVDYLRAPSLLPQSLLDRCEAVARQVATAFAISGLLAVELFVDDHGQVLINEVAPRPHNSGHHTIELYGTSQFEQHIRGVLNLPLLPTRAHQSAVMLNILGEAGYSGDVRYEGMQAVAALPGVHVHLYGKTTTRPNRKMGHATIIADDPTTAMHTAQQVKNLLHCKGAVQA